MQELHDLGTTAPLGEVPRFMHAALIRRSRYGQPAKAFEIEVVEVPPVGPKQVLVSVMAAGINYNGVWAALGAPADVIALRQKKGDPHDFHIAGTEGSGVVYAVGSEVTQFRVGDHVIFGGLQWNESAPDIRLGVDPTASRSQVAWGYESNFGAFSQYCLVDEYQCYAKPPALTWEGAGAMIGCAATAYRQLFGWHPHTVQPGDPVLVWGGAGGLGSMAIQLVSQFGGRPVAVVSSEAKAEHCRRLGAVGVIDRSEFDHWGRMPDQDTPEYARWMAGVRAFGRKFWEVLGERRNPRIVFEHPGRDTLPTSVYLCDNAGMVVTCAGTSGYNGDLDLRFLWMHQKRLQGSHAANVRETAAMVQLAGAGRLDPCVTVAEPISEIGSLHQALYENRHEPGNMAVLIGASAPGQTG
ncbi:crotonyl-CoA carboxylase/reductase [Micromonospora sp. NPDC023814]|uniref:crotonyl-CoA carboxylase/reductase n=1 Tax=Micromonospora sp. NPDC023814 TaxID=3154596 RepID=UPI0033F86EFE